MNIYKAKRPLLIIAGPTATGKSAVAIDIAKKINGEIISADSMQVYKYMDVGTAKISEKEQLEVKHYLVDVFKPDFDFSVAIFKNLAKEAALDIIARGKIPILTGGTGFYINALIYDNDFLSEDELNKDYTYRNKLITLSKEKGNLYIHDLLKEVDEVSAEKIHPNNIKRVIRALEFYNENKRKISDHNRKEKQRDAFFDSSMFVLNLDRNILYDRINKRVDIMVKNGLIDEVKGLLDMGYNKDLTSMQGLGYKEIIKYLLGEYTLEDAIEVLKRDTRHFAKRQLTWFKNQSKANWIDVLKYNDSSEVSDSIIKMILG